MELGYKKYDTFELSDIENDEFDQGDLEIIENDFRLLGEEAIEAVLERYKDDPWNGIDEDAANNCLDDLCDDIKTGNKPNGELAALILSCLKENDGEPDNELISFLYDSFYAEEEFSDDLD